MLSRLGRIYLYLRLRSRERVQRELHRRYEGRFRNAGLTLLFDLLMALAVVAFVAILAAVIYYFAN
jgi:hypothetical protein